MCYQALTTHQSSLAGDKFETMSSPMVRALQIECMEAHAIRTTVKPKLKRIFSHFGQE